MILKKFVMWIVKMEEDDDIQNNGSGCGQCGAKYGGGFWFCGLAYNTGLNKNDPDDPIEYEGYVKTYNFFRCECKDEENEILCSKEEDNIPFLVIRCETTDNITLIDHCILFNIKYGQKN